MSAALEQQVATALVADTTSADLTALIAETEAAITVADATASAERTKSLDPVLSPDAKAAREVMAAAEFDRDRLRTVLPRLQQRLQEVQAQEYAAGWLADYEQVKIKRDEAAEKFKRYFDLANEIIELLRGCETVDAEIDFLNRTAPAGEWRRLSGVELTARHLDAFSRDHPELITSLELPEVFSAELNRRRAWNATIANTAVAVPYHPGSHWADPDVQERRRAAIEKEQRELAEYHGQAAKAQEERQNREERERFALGTNRSR